MTEPANAATAPGRDAVRIYEMEPSLANLTEMTLKRPDDVRTVLRGEREQPRAILNLLLLGLAGIGLYSIVFTVIIATADRVLPFMTPVRLDDATVFKPFLVYSVGMVAALGICLPAFYFYGLLAGVRATMLQMTAISLHAFARSGIILMGLLPLYVAAILGIDILGYTDRLSYDILLGWGVILPFVAGATSLRVAYLGFTDLLRTLPEARAERRAPMVRLLAVAWAVLYTVVAPVTLWAVKTNLETVL